ncbi:MAG: hypothetical protein IKI76_05950 [Selenomonadaceae bacterium]|nr:hypothetical protein [Selenomonadaceae bacterium]
MKKFIAAAVCAGMIFNSGIYVVPVFAQNYSEEVKVSTIPEGNAYIPKGTILQVELTKELSSKKSKVGDAVPLRLVENLIVNDVIVVPAGSDVKGVVTKARKAGGLGRGGKLEFTIVSVKTINGVEIPLQYTKGEHGAGDGGAVAVVAFVSIVGGIFMKGKNVVYNEGLKFDVQVTADTDLKVPLENLQEVMDMSKPHGVSIHIQ